MLRNKPTLGYCGLSIVLSSPSRFDVKSGNLLSSLGGDCLNKFCLQPEFNLAQCDIRVMEDKTDWLPGTKCILLAGEHAMWEYAKDTGGNTLNEMRGSPLTVDGIPAIASFFPQDAADPRILDRYHNPLSKEYQDGAEEEQENEDEEGGDEKEHSRTQQKNYAFWLRADVRKCKKILLGEPRITEPVVSYKIYPSATEVINVLTNTKGKILEFDIETDYEEQNLLCFAFTFWSLVEDKITTYSVPCLNHEYKWAYPNLHLILRALVVAFYDNIVSGWNIAAFDLLVMAMKYHMMPGPRCYDGMIAMHRIYPRVEKSLGHAISYWTDERFHKDSDSKSYHTYDDMIRKLKYCGKDVYGTALTHREMELYKTRVPGLAESIQCAMDSIRPYLICSLTGIRYSEEARLASCEENDLLMNQYNRIINLLIGEEGIKEARSVVKSKKPAMFASSNPQCVNYFYDQLGYDQVGRKTKKGGISLGKKNLFLLALKYNNPVITYANLFRTVKKEYSSLKFYPWKDDNNRITKYVESK